MRKGTFKIKVIAVAISAASVFGPAATSFNVTTYAAEENIFTENGKQIGIDVADAAFDTIADLFPGGKLVLAPFKTLFHAGVDDKDPMEVITGCHQLHKAHHSCHLPAQLVHSSQVLVSSRY